MEVGLLGEESRINSTEISLITVCDTHLYTNSNGDSELSPISDYVSWAQ